jgi:hypothetical protein
MDWLDKRSCRRKYNKADEQMKSNAAVVDDADPLDGFSG